MRLAKWYSDGSGEGAYNSAKQRAAVVREVTGEIMMRKGKHCNFMELSRRNDVIVTYKRFAGLYFIIGINKGTDNELIALETIQVRTPARKPPAFFAVRRLPRRSAG